MTSHCGTSSVHDWFSPYDNLTADRDKWRDRCERLISWYGHPQEWRCNVSRYNYGHECSLDECVKREYNSGSHGFSFAQQIQQEIDDDAN